MRLALLCGANPRRCLKGPVVRLPPGSWRLHVEHAVDSHIGLKLESGDGWSLFKDGRVAVGGIDNEHPRDVQVEFVVRGSEQFVNVFAEKVA